MHKSFSKKIKYSFSFLVIAVMLISTAASFFVIRNLVVSDFNAKAESQVRMLGQSIRLYTNVIEETANMVLQNDKLIEALKSPSYQVDLVPLLNSLRGSYSAIRGLSVYGVNGTLYTSDKIAFPPALDYLREKQYLDGLTEENPSHWRVRMDAKDGYYINYSGYGEDSGLFSYLCRITDYDGGFLGYLVLDTPLSEISKFFANVEFFSDNDVKVLYEDSNGIVSADGLPGEPGDKSDRPGYKLYRLETAHSDMTVNVYVSSKPQAKQMAKALGLMLGCCLVILLIFFAVLRRLIQSFTVSIDELEAGIVSYAQSKTFNEKGELSDD